MEAHCSSRRTSSVSGVGRPREVGGRWEQFWAGVRATGDGGDVLWDASDSAEAARYLDLLAEHADPRCPSSTSAAATGGSPARWRTGSRASSASTSPRPPSRSPTAESAGTPAVTFRALDMTAPDAGHVLRDDVGGDANVFVRGVLHILDVPARRRTGGQHRHARSAPGAGS